MTIETRRSEGGRVRRGTVAAMIAREFSFAYFWFSHRLADGEASA
jgi:hypothetical protein